MPVLHVDLRDMTRADRRRVARIWLDSWRSTGLAEFADPPESELYGDLERPGWLVRLTSSGSDIVGFAAFDVKPAQFCQLLVDPLHQGAGVGTLLLDEVKRHLAGGFWLRTAVGQSARQGVLQTAWAAPRRRVLPPYLRQAGGHLRLAMTSRGHGPPTLALTAPT